MPTLIDVSLPCSFPTWGTLTSTEGRAGLRPFLVLVTVLMTLAGGNEAINIAAFTALGRATQIPDIQMGLALETHPESPPVTALSGFGRPNGRIEE